ncbi:hypothetical protein D3C86_1599960 [compost metagenome]
MSTFCSKALLLANLSTITEWSITRSTGDSGLIRCGLPPALAIAARMAARSTTAGTPVKSCISTRAGRYWISRSERRSLSHAASALRSAPVTVFSSSQRSRFSSRTFNDIGNLSRSPRLLAASGRLK